GRRRPWGATLRVCLRGFPAAPDEAVHRDPAGDVAQAGDEDRYPVAQTAGAGWREVAVPPPRISASAGTRRRCATPSADMISISAAAAKAAMAPTSMICPISQNA